ncbi:hypothetical protein [Thalassospira sp. CH_XMU1420-2]|uniref:hypothetical protein n=1 Tax=Thalassospira sp. CH_XMU1420-2 TaxID=3107769 RepID=UPI003009D0D3
MAIYVSIGSLVERKAMFSGTAVATLTAQAEAAIENLCNAVATHYGVERRALVYTDDHAVLCPMQFKEVPETIRFGCDELGLNISCFLMQHDLIDSPTVTSAAKAFAEQFRALGESLATHYSVRFVDFAIDYALELQLAATHEGQDCPEDLQAFDEGGELNFYETDGTGE